MSKKKYQPLTIPRLSWNKETLSHTYAELVAQPLEPGFGITLGNALRRVLLGGVEGSAVTSVVIAGLTMNLHRCRALWKIRCSLCLILSSWWCRNKTGEPGKMTLKVKGEATATAGDITADEHLEIVNKDHVLAHVADGGLLDVEFFVESGRGYQPAKWPIGQALQEDNRIYLDATFFSGD